MPSDWAGADNDDVVMGGFRHGDFRGAGGGRGKKRDRPEHARESRMVNISPLAEMMAIWEALLVRGKLP